jgi:hypothetical protein
VIAIIAADSDVRRGPIPIALAYAGFETQAATSDEADRAVETRGGEECVLVLGADALERGAGTVWSGFLARHPAVAAVVVAHGSPGIARTVAGGPHRILVGDPFDAAAVVSAARRAAKLRRRSAAARRVPRAQRRIG